ncbi:MAG: sulfurtransferase TusA family protein [Candidatus Anammoxibacter sp.]
MDNTDELTPDESLDLSGVKCPINFVKTKLKMEDMETGQLLEVIVDDGEPIRSVPKSLKEEGHKILKVDDLGGKYRLLVKVC